MITALIATAMLAGDGVQVTFIPEGAVKRAGGYRPLRANFDDKLPGGLKKPNMKNPQYGKMMFGDKAIAFVIDEVDDSTIYVDANSNGDFTDDAAPKWTATKRGEFKLYQGSAMVNLDGKKVGINFYRFDPKDPQRVALKSTLLYYGDFGYDVKLTLGGKTYTSAIAGDPDKTTSIWVDRNGDGQRSYNYETVQVGKPFNYTGTTLVLNLTKGKLSLDKATEQLPLANQAPNLALGQKALPFTATTIDGSKVSFPDSYKGKVVMLDFWATWCGPCIAEMPNVIKAYDQYHDKGFEILGVSFDQENMTDKVNAFTKEKNMPWKQVYEGKYWSTTLGAQYDVSGIPFCLLVDGDTGEILGTPKEMRGEGLSAFIEKMLAKKKGAGR